MYRQQIIRVGVFASSSLDEVKLVVIDMLVMLNRMFVPRGVEFVLADSSDDATGEDLAIVLYWRDFGDLPLPKFETAYESLKAGGNPAKIYVFFRETSDELDEAMRAFKDSFATKYGHFYCHFEHVDSVRFQFATQCLAYLPNNRVDDMIKLDDGGKISIFGQHIADMENLPFAKLNSKCKSLKRQIAAAEAEVANLEDESAADPDDDDLKDSLREARVRRHDLKEELKQYNGFLFSTALFFAKEAAKDMDERVRQAKELFEQGKVQAANKILDLPEMVDRANLNLKLFSQHREVCEKDSQAFTAKAEMVMADDSLAIPERVRQACEAYDNAIRIARVIHMDEQSYMGILFDYGVLLQRQNRFQPAIVRYLEALAIQRKLAKVQSEVYKPYVAASLHNLANLHRKTQRRSEAESEFVEALAIYRNLTNTQSKAYAPDLAGTLNDLALLHVDTQQLSKAESEYVEALSICRKLANVQPKLYEESVAKTLNNLALLYRNIRRIQEAEMAFVEALVIRRELAAVDREAYEPFVAGTLNNLAILHRDMRRFPEAESEYLESLDICRNLAAVNPEMFEPELAMTLDGLANLHNDMYRLAEAETEYTEALAIRRKLAKCQPQVFELYVAATLNNLASLHYKIERLLDAEVEYCEALTIWRKFAEVQPEVYDPYVAATLNNLAVFHDQTQRFDEAEVEYLESLRIRRKLVALHPKVCAISMAMTLNDLANLHRKTRRLREAEIEYKESLGIYRKLSEEQPEVYEENVAMKLYDLGLFYKDVGQKQKALVAVRKALEVFTDCAARNPERFKEDVEDAKTLVAYLEEMI